MKYKVYYKYVDVVKANHSQPGKITFHNAHGDGASGWIIVPWDEWEEFLQERIKQQAEWMKKLEADLAEYQAQQKEARKNEVLQE